MITDPVYEGKSMQGMIDLIDMGFPQRVKNSVRPPRHSGP